MSKSKFKVLLSFLLIMIFATSICFATEETTGLTTAPVTSETDVSTGTNTESTPSGRKVISGDLYVCEQNVTISDTVDGNVYIMANEVTISKTSQIQGDAFIMANKVIIEPGSYTYNSMFILANDVSIDGTVYNVYAACSSFNLESNGVVYRDLKLIASNANLYGQVYRNADLSVNSMNLSRAFQAVVRGNLTYSSNTESSIPEGAVAGEVRFIQSNIDTQKNIGSIIADHILDLLRALLLTFVVTIILLWLTPKFVDRVSKTGVGKAFISLGIGFVTPIGLTLAGIILLITIIGSPVLICTVLSFIVLSYIGTCVTSIFFGKLIANKFKMEGNVKIVLFTLLSCSVIWLLSQVPFIGPFVSYLSSTLGIGLTIVNMISRKEKVEEKSK